MKCCHRDKRILPDVMYSLDWKTLKLLFCQNGGPIISSISWFIIVFLDPDEFHSSETNEDFNTVGLDSSLLVMLS